MVKFITRTICMALVAMLCVGNLSAQNANSVLKNVSSAEREMAQKQAAVGGQLQNFASTFAMHPKGVAMEEVLNESFADGTLPSGWTTLDVDNDGYTWRFTFANSGGVQIPSEGRTDAHSINTASYYNDAGALTPDNWLITPKIELGGNTVLTYWVKVIDPLYPSDTYGVYVSTSGTAPSDFTQSFQETLTSAAASWVERTVEISQSGDCYIAFRHFNSNDQYVFCVDDIVVETEEGNTPCPAVTNLKAEVQGTDVVVTWDAASGTPTGYKVYLDDAEKTTEPGLTHTLTGVAGGKHTVSVAATYSDGCTPKKVTTPEFTVGNCDGVKNFKAEYNANCGADLSWDAVTKERSELIWDNVVPTTTSGLISVYWETSDVLVQIADDFEVEAGTSIEYLTTAGFCNNSTIPTRYGIRFYTDNNEAPGEELWVDNLASGTDDGTGNITITLSEPFDVPSAGKYWVSMYGYRESAQDFNTRFDFYTSTTGIGSKLYLKDHTNLFGSGTNWMPVDPGLVAGVLSVTFSLYGTKNSGPVESLYNVYRDGEKIADKIKETTYTDPTFDTSVGHEWAVAVVCANGADSEWARKPLDACDPPVPCDPPTNVKAENVGDGVCVIQLTWDGEGVFHVTKDGDDLGAQTSPYKDEAVAAGVTYRYCVYQVCDDEQSESVCVDAACPEGINDLKGSVNIYPNPATSVVTINGKDVAKVEVYNVVGQMVEMKTGEIRTIDVSTYNNGIYLFRVYDSNNNVVTKRIMVTK